MSKVIACSRPEARAASKAPATPPAGPESTVRTASRPACAALMLPPFDCMMRSRGGAPPAEAASARPASRALR